MQIAMLLSLLCPLCVCSAYSKMISQHHGIDIENPVGADVKASYSGTVVSVAPFKRGENQVTVRNRDGNEIVYVYVTPLVSVGQHVYSGDVIGKSDSSGRSISGKLHFGIKSYPDGVFVDPMKYLPVK